MEFNLEHTFSFAPEGRRKAARRGVVKERIINPITCHVHYPTLRNGTIFAGQEDGTILRIHPKETQKKKQSTPLEGHKGRVNCVKYVHEWNILISGSADRTVRVWDPWAPTPVQTLVGHGGSVNSVAFTKPFVVSCSTDCTVRIWIADENRLQYLLYPWFNFHQTVPSPTGGWVTAVDTQTTAGNNFGNLIITDSTGSTSILKSFQRDGNPAPNGPNRQTLYEARKRPRKIHRLGITHILLSQQEHFLFTVSFDARMRVFDQNTELCVIVVENINKCRFTALDWSSERQELYLGDEKGYIHVWNVLQDKCLKMERLTTGPIRSLSAHGSQNLIYVSHHDVVECWRISRDVNYQNYAGHTGPIVSMINITHPDPRRPVENRFFSASLDNSIVCWDPYDMTQQSAWHEKESEILCMEYSPNTKQILTGHEDGSLHLWKKDSGGHVVVEGHKNSMSCICLAKVSREDFILTGSFDGTFGVWEIKPQLNALPALRDMIHAQGAKDFDEILCICYNEKNETVVVAGNDSVIRCFSLTSFELEITMRGHTDSVTALKLDENFLLSGSDDCSIRVWDSLAGTPLKTIAGLDGHSMTVRDLLLIPKTSYLVSCSPDRTVRIWDYARSEKPIKMFQHEEEFRCLAYKNYLDNAMTGKMQAVAESGAAQQNSGFILVGTEQAHIVTFPVTMDMLRTASDNVMGVNDHADKENALPERTIVMPSFSPDSGDAITKFMKEQESKDLKDFTKPLEKSFIDENTQIKSADVRRALKEGGFQSQLDDDLAPAVSRRATSEGEDMADLPYGTGRRSSTARSIARQNSDISQKALGNIKE